MISARAALVVVAATAAAGGCKQGKGGGTPLPERAAVVQHVAIDNVELDIKLPDGMKPEIKAGEAHWIASADDTLDVLVQVASPTAQQNAINFEEQTGRRLSRTDQTADGWTITSHDQDGGFLLSKRMIQKDQRAVFCTATMSWKRPGHDPKRNEFVESICASLVPTKL